MGLFGGGGSQPKVIPEFTGLQVNTAVQVLPVPIIWGSPRVSTNLIYYNGFNSQLVATSSGGGGKGVASGGGKGGGGSNKQVEYFATICLAIGEGIIGPAVIIYQDQEVWTPDTYPTNGTNFFEGTPSQSPWSYVEDNWPGDARPYVSTCYYGFPNAQIDSSATVPQINFVIKGFFNGSCPLNNSTITISTGQYDPQGNPLSYIGDINFGTCDADPAEVIFDYLTNEQYGAGFPTEYIDQSTLFTSPQGYYADTGDQSVSSFCQAVGLGWSVCLSNAEQASGVLDRWCSNLNVAIVWTGQYLRFIPYWDSYADGNPGWDSSNGIAKKYYSPITAPSFNIPLDQILQTESNEEDPITYTRKDPWEVYNTVRLEFRDRTNYFNPNPVEAKDEALCENYGPRVDNIGSADEFTLQTYANVSAQMKLRRNAGIRRTFTWKMGPLWAWMDPMNVCTIPDPVTLTETVLVRIISVEDDEDENITVQAEEFPVGAQSPTTIPMQPTTPPNQGPTNNPPSPIYVPVMLVTPTLLYQAQGLAVSQWIFGASAGTTGVLDTNWGGCYIWVSLDNESYQQLGVLQHASTIGGTQSNLAAYGGANPDNTDSLVVNLSESDGTLGSFTSSAAASGSSIFALQDASGIEILGYTTATMTAPNTYTLTGLYRGLYGTTSRFWGIGSRFLFLGSSGNFFETPVQPQYIGKTFYVKAQSYNVFNNAVQDLSDCVAYQFILTSSTPQPPTPPPAVPGKNPARLRRLFGENFIGGKGRKGR